MKMRTWLLGLGMIALVAACSDDPVKGGTDTGSSTDTGARVDQGNSDAGGGTDAGALRNDCQLHSDCRLVSKGCCAPCGLPTGDSHIAIRTDQVDAYRAGMECELVDCEPCPAIEILAPTGNVRAICNASNQCETYVVSESDEAACSNDDECVRRWGTCCAPCVGADNWDYVAINGSADAAYASKVCDGDDVTCPECASPDYPGDFEAVCDGDSQCVLFGDGGS